ncbi:hypothetical protein [Nocardiopsis halophila]|uniref:hypothetical protein n=1 Tax=Nocardiopsis halophila TaxID=141692 RepID=UPI00034CB3FB|nr:hypothetical protein [Nocardiopsis halophila]
MTARVLFTAAAVLVAAAAGTGLHLLVGPAAWPLIAGPALLAWADAGTWLGLWAPADDPMPAAHEEGVAQP